MCDSSKYMIRCVYCSGPYDVNFDSDKTTNVPKAMFTEHERELAQVEPVHKKHRIDNSYTNTFTTTTHMQSHNAAQHNSDLFPK